MRKLVHVLLVLAALAAGATLPAPVDARSTPVTKLTLSANAQGMLMFSRTRLTARAGIVDITFVNHSPLPHNLTVQRGANGAVLGATPTFRGGSRTLRLRLSAGTYTYFCSVPGHRQGGMKGTLIVK